MARYEVHADGRLVYRGADREKAVGVYHAHVRGHRVSMTQDGDLVRASDGPERRYGNVSPQYEVIVGGTRTIYRGPDKAMAAALFSEHRQAKRHTLLVRDGEALVEVYGNSQKGRMARKKHSIAVGRNSRGMFTRAR